MSDVVAKALDHSYLNGIAGSGTIWDITFLNNESRSGKIHPLGEGTYLLEAAHHSRYFSGDHVLYLYPEAAPGSRTLGTE